MIEGFCEGPFWDWEKTWPKRNGNQSDYYGPDLTICFQQTILTWIPWIFLWLSVPFEIFQNLKCFSKSRHRRKIMPADSTSPDSLSSDSSTITIKSRAKILSIPWTILNILKCFGICLLMILHCIQLVHTIIIVHEGQVPEYIVTTLNPLVWILTFSLALFAVRNEKVKGIPSSGTQFIFWALTVICGVFPFRTAILKSAHTPHIESRTFERAIQMSTFPLLLLQLIFNSVADSGKSLMKGNRKNPERSASFISRILFLWCEPLLWKGYKKPLEIGDLWELSDEDKCNHYTGPFENHWEKVKLTSSNLNPSILGTLFHLFLKPFFFGGFLKLCQDCLVLTAPQILKLLVSFIENREEVWKGVFYVCILCLTTIIQTLFLAQYFKHMFVVGMRCKSLLVSVIYRKALLISNSARKGSTVGEIVNLMSVDAANFMELIPFLNMLWSAPFQITMCLYFLWEMLGWSVLPGLAVLLIILPINSLLSSLIKKLQIKQMKRKDQRLKFMSELISGIKVLKLNCWESSFQNEINNIRDKEMDILMSTTWIEVLISFLSISTTFLVALASFATYVMVDNNHVFNASKAFVSLTLFGVMRVPLSMLPGVISNVVKAQVSLQRINKFLNSSEIDPKSVTHFENFEYSITIENGSFTWGDEANDFNLKNITLNIPKGSLVIIIGPVGSGKSSLLAAILGELTRTSGTPVNTWGSMAYVAQQAWIQSGTIRENIVFDSPTVDVARYQNVLDSCALLPDLASLSNGDQTHISEKGKNLSGGQKQRVALARGAYNDADIYLFDDSFSALDGRVGQHIFTKLIGPNGLLKKKTRLLVTHDLTHLKSADQVIIMSNGEISQVGTWSELLTSKMLDFPNFVTAQNVSTDKSEAEILPSTNDEDNDTHPKYSAKPIPQPQKLSDPNDISSTTLISKEVTEVGSVKKDVYLYYMKSIGTSLVLFTMVLQFLSQGFSILTNIWLAKWSSHETDENGSQDPSKRVMYIGFYAGFGFGQIIFFILSCFTMSHGMSQASAYLHSQMLTRILRAPMKFFESTPHGRILNRFGKDVDTLDSVLPSNFRDYLFCLLSVVSTVIIISYSMPIFILVIIPITILYVFIQRYYLATSRELKRMESVSRSPIHTHFDETLSGLTTIRAFGLLENFTKEFEVKVDLNQTTYYPFVITNRWLSIRLEMIANSIILIVGLMAVLQVEDELSSGLAGLSISYALQVTGTLNWVVRMSSSLETNIVAVERIKEYSEVDMEAEDQIESTKPKENWPERGEICFQGGYATTYHPGMNPVLHDINCKIHSGEKIGIVGRTGGGKSSLVLGLFRLIEPISGTIKIDGQNISSLGLKDLRSRLTIIPQDPVLFSGSLRFNLDPFGYHKDEELYNALEKSNLKQFVQGLHGGLYYEVQEGGENFSVGQRQQICLARALLRKSKILILDEATSSVDLETDGFIQVVIRKEFATATVLTIAHRINTIMDSTRVMVLDKGRIQEFDSPATLLNNTQSMFSAIVKEAGLV